MNSSIIILILGMGIVTYIPRVLPLVSLSTKELSPAILKWLDMVPPAVLAALLAPELLLTKQDQVYSFFISSHNPILIASIPAIIIAWFTKNIFATVATGMICVALLRYMAL